MTTNMATKAQAAALLRSGQPVKLRGFVVGDYGQSIHKYSKGSFPEGWDSFVQLHDSRRYPKACKTLSALLCSKAGDAEKRKILGKIPSFASVKFFKAWASYRPTRDFLQNSIALIAAIEGPVSSRFLWKVSSAVMSEGGPEQFEMWRKDLQEALKGVEASSYFPQIADPGSFRREKELYFNKQGKSARRLVLKSGGTVFDTAFSTADIQAQNHFLLDLVVNEEVWKAAYILKSCKDQGRINYLFFMLKDRPLELSWLFGAVLKTCETEAVCEALMQLDDYTRTFLLFQKEIPYQNTASDVATLQNIRRSAAPSISAPALAKACRDQGRNLEPMSYLIESKVIPIDRIKSNFRLFAADVRLVADIFRLLDDATILNGYNEHDAVQLAIYFAAKDEEERKVFPSDELRKLSALYPSVRRRLIDLYAGLLNEGRALCDVYYAADGIRLLNLDGVPAAKIRGARFALLRWLKIIGQDQQGGKQAYANIFYRAFRHLGGALQPFEKKDEGIQVFEKKGSSCGIWPAGAILPSCLRVISDGVCYELSLPSGRMQVVDDRYVFYGFPDQLQSFLPELQSNKADLAAKMDAAFSLQMQNIPAIDRGALSILERMTGKTLDEITPSTLCLDLHRHQILKMAIAVMGDKASVDALFGRLADSHDENVRAALNSVLSFFIDLLMTIEKGKEGIIFSEKILLFEEFGDEIIKKEVKKVKNPHRIA